MPATTPASGRRASDFRRAGGFRCDPLEPRLLLAIYAVTSTADSGAGTLRQAILNANANAGVDAITFNLAPAGVVHTISPVTMLPAITGPTSIDGRTQPGFTGVRPLIQLSGNLSPAGGNGLMLQNATGSVIRSLIINRFSNHGVILSGGSNVVMAGNWIGLDAAGTVPAPNRIGVLSNAGGSRFGGTTADARNVVSGNTEYGLQLEGNDNVVTGNYVGTNADGTRAAGNGIGVNFRGSRNRVGGVATGEGNLISGNATGVRIGVETSGTPDATGNVVAGNFIGTQAGGTGRVANREQGVWLMGGVAGTVIGGTATSSGNLIAGNGVGILMSGPPASAGNTPARPRDNRVEGNVIGLDRTRARLSNDTGVSIAGGTGNVVGGVTPETRNIISGNGYGVRIIGAATSKNRVQGNYIGLRPDGTGGAVNNSVGVSIEGATQNVIGGEGGGNVISNNFANGIAIFATATLGPATGNRIFGNYIGTDPTGTLDLGNGGGIEITDAADNTIGGAFALQQRNVISGNNGAGITITGPRNRVHGNYIGTNAAGTAAIPNGTGVAVAGSSVQDGAADNAIGGVLAGQGNLISGNGTGVLVQGVNAANTLVQGNYIGTNAAGTAAVPNASGVLIRNTRSNTIGGDTAAARNLISGNNGDGLLVDKSESVVVRNNYVGVTAAGTAALGNHGAGILVAGGSGAGVDGNNQVADNVLSGNRWGLVFADARGNTVVRNRIGLAATGSTTVPNTGAGAGDGIQINGVSTRNVIGGAGPMADVANIIAGNDGHGVVIGFAATSNVVQGNHIGWAPGTFGPPILIGNRLHGALVAGSNNRVVGNSIILNDLAGIAVTGGANNALLRNSMGNGGLGIDLWPAGVTLNDAGDADAGANALQNFPVIGGVVSDGAGTTVSGTLNSRPNLSYEVEIFSTATTDPSGRGEGETFLGSVVVTTDSAGNASFSATLAPVTVGRGVTATASRVANGVPVETSEFSPTVVVPPVFNPAPRVAAVFVGGTAWADAFNLHLQNTGRGERPFGFAVPAGAAQLAPLPWANLNKISLRFNEHVSVHVDDLVVRAAAGDGTTPTPQYAFASFAYDPATRTATWQLRQSVRADRLRLDLDADGATGVKDTAGNALDGEWADGQSLFPSGDRAAGGDFLFRFNVVPGDANRSGVPNVLDEAQVRRRFGGALSADGTPSAGYSLFCDLDGSGRINAVDVSIVRLRQRRGLP